MITTQTTVIVGHNFVFQRLILKRVNLSFDTRISVADGVACPSQQLFVLGSTLRVTYEPRSRAADETESGQTALGGWGT